jgi:N-acetylglucosamine malate deacetylase 1
MPGGVELHVLEFALHPYVAETEFEHALDLPGYFGNRCDPAFIIHSKKYSAYCANFKYRKKFCILAQSKNRTKENQIVKVDVLAIGAHPDDIELSCAATVAKCVKRGYSVGILDLSEGELGTRGTREIRKKEAETSAGILGVSFRTSLGLPDGNIEVSRENITKVIKVIRTHSPSILLFPHWLERHPDHEHAHRLCREAWFYAGLEKYKTTVGGKQQEPHRPKKFFHFMQKFEFTPSIIVDVSDVYDVKKQALAAFSSQFHNPHSSERETLLSQKIFLDQVYARDMHFGSLINAAYGEPFYTIELVGVETLFDIR